MEIGGFFEFPQFDCREHRDSVYYYLINTYKGGEYSFFQDGRQSIKSVLLNINNIRDKICYLPSYLCDSILQPFEELNLNVKFYSLQHPLEPKIEKNIENSLVYIIDYFGTQCLDEKEICHFLEKGNIIILDITHSIFNEYRYRIKHENLYMISSLRKLFPIPDGAILYHTNSSFEAKKSFPEDYGKMLEAMLLKTFYLEDTLKNEYFKNKETKNEFLSMYRSYETSKDKGLIKIQNIPRISVYILKNICYKKILNRRFENLQYIYNNFHQKDDLLYSINDLKSPFIFPIIFKTQKQRDRIKKILIKNEFYTPIHWNLNNIVPEYFKYEHGISSRILAIPIDQRYTPQDLKKLINILARELS
ncbi:MAG: hypothetical protein PHV51_02460 [Methanosarcinaceae archaeon]|nr:hypothetical protein [Methanosarcinaceae archaeon]